MKKYIASSVWNIVFIVLINNCLHFNIYEQDKFRAQLNWAWKKFYNLGASLIWVKRIAFNLHDCCLETP